METERGRKSEIKGKADKLVRLMATGHSESKRIGEGLKPKCLKNCQT
jgi:hypothetical protein